MLPTTSSHQNVRAKLVDKNRRLHLLVSFGTSSPPILWYYDLKRTSSMSLYLKEKEGEWDLGTTLPDGKFSVIAHFDERGNAEKAFTTVRKALMKKHLFSSLGPWTRLALFLLLLFFALILFNPPISVDPSTGHEATTKAQQSTDSKKIVPGVPMNADDVMLPPAD